MVDENDLPENDDVKKKALMRLAVAGLVTATALAGLWWLDQGKQEKPHQAAQAPQPVPIRPAAAPEPPMPQSEAPTPPETVAQAPTAEPSPTEGAPAEAAPAREAPPPPRVSNIPATAPAVTTPPPLRPAPHAATAPAPAPMPPASAAGGSFLVQLGVFSDPAHAQDLVRTLRQKGIRASSETRVHVGPFLNRQEAEKAQAELRRLGLNAVITTATPIR
ncbi:MAG: SPOR domain-containing protein [Pseudomonadota bacterium]